MQVNPLVIFHSSREQLVGSHILLIKVYFINSPMLLKLKKSSRKNVHGSRQVSMDVRDPATSGPILVLLRELRAGYATVVVAVLRRPDYNL